MNGTKPGVVLNCRTCTRACKQYKSLQDEIEIGPEGSTTLANMLQFCSSLSFEPQDGAAMPQHICMHCLQLLEQAFNFKRMVIDSDELLRLGLEEVDSNANASSGQEYVMIEVLNEEAEPDAGKQDTSCSVEVAALVEAYSEQEPEPEPEHEEFVVDDVCVDAEEEVGAETETEDANEPINELHAADVEYVTIKTEYDSQVEDEDEIEIIDSPPMETVSEQMQIQMLDDQMVMISGEEPIDEVIGEVEAEDILDIEREEHLVSKHFNIYVKFNYNVNF